MEQETMKRFIIIQLILISFFSCKKENESSPAVTTMSVSLITSTSAFSGFNVESAKFNTCTTLSSRGICWNTSPNPTVNGGVVGSTLYGGCSTGQGQMQLVFLTPNTTYYVRAYAVYSLDGNAGTAYGNEVSFTTLK